MLWHMQSRCGYYCKNAERQELTIFKAFSNSLSLVPDGARRVLGFVPCMGSMASHDDMRL